MEFSISYITETFDSIIEVGLIKDVVGGSLEVIRENSFDIVRQYLEEKEDEDVAWHCNLKSIKITVKETKP